MTMRRMATVALGIVAALGVVTEIVRFISPDQSTGSRLIYRTPRG
jgi:hypothetical protein